MSTTKKVAFLAGAALSLGVLSPAMAQSSLNRDRALNQELTADSLTRTSLQGGGGGSGFKITDGSDSLTIGGLVQFRYTANWRSDGTSTQPAGTIDNDDSFTQGFANTKTKLWFKGTVGSPDLSFYIQGDFFGDSSNMGNFALDDAWGAYKLNDNWDVKWGQFKLPVFREELVSEQNQLSAQRSVTNAAFNQGRSHAVQLGYKSDQFRAMFAFGDGARSKNTEFDAAGTAQSDWSLTGRGEFMFQGTNWDRYNDFTSFKGDPFTGMVGAAVHYQEAGNTGDGTDAGAPAGNPPGTSFFLYTLDCSLEGDGWNVYGALLGSNIDPEAAGESSTNSFGVVVQGGIFLDPNWELFGRWDAIFADSDAGTPVPPATTVDPSDFHFLTLGVNYYLIPKKQTMKFTADVVIALTETYDLLSIDPLSGGGGTSAPGYGAPLRYRQGGILGDIDTGEFAVQLQVQVLF